LTKYRFEKNATSTILYASKSPKFTGWKKKKNNNNNKQGKSKKKTRSRSFFSMLFLPLSVFFALLPATRALEIPAEPPAASHALWTCLLDGLPNNHTTAGLSLGCSAVCVFIIIIIFFFSFLFWGIGSFCLLPLRGKTQRCSTLLSSNLVLFLKK
jgi:hypothetical protein